MSAGPVTTLPTPAIVLDTNIVLDLWVFSDPATPPLAKVLEERSVQWIATPPMREELLRVLDYAHLVAKMAYYRIESAEVLRRFDALVQIKAVAPKAAFVCKDSDDQKFIDLAAAHQAMLISKDKAVLCMTRRLERLGVAVYKAWPDTTPQPI